LLTIVLVTIVKLGLHYCRLVVCCTPISCQVVWAQAEMSLLSLKHLLMMMMMVMMMMPVLSL